MMYIRIAALDQMTYMVIINRKHIYRKVASSRPVYYSILELFCQRSHYISIKFSLHKSSENVLLTKLLTPPNSEIICVQNVGAKVEMVSYLKNKLKY